MKEVAKKGRRKWGGGEEGRRNGTNKVTEVRRKEGRKEGKKERGGQGEWMAEREGGRKQ